MEQRADQLELGALHLAPGEGRRLTRAVAIAPFTLGGDRYTVEPSEPLVELRVSRTLGRGFALRMRFTVTLAGRCMRCLEPAAPSFEIDAREVAEPHAGADLESPYVEADVLDLASWAHDALALTLPATILCRVDCAGLCPVCGENLNRAGPEHGHEQPPDPRFAKLSRLRFDR